MTTIQMKHPDILLLVGNHLFLLIQATLGNNPRVTFTQSLASLWEYVRPWQLIGLGMKPIYPKAHKTGSSVLDRHRLLKRLRKKIVQKNKSLDRRTSLAKIRFGQMIVIPSSESVGSTLLWLLFQRSSGINDMNVALLNPRGINPTPDPLGILQEIVFGKTLWSESDLNLLKKYARLQGDETKVRILVAEQHREQILWADDRERRRWIPIGRLHYTTRRFEDVTLVRTLELSKISYLQPVDYDDIRRPHQRLEDMILRALVILNKGLKECAPATCKVLLDADEKMYRIIFDEKSTGNKIGEILINRTVDLLEILRRPEDECEPVIIEGTRLIWNRFNDISYNDDVAVLRPWVIRYDPFPNMSLKLPPTAQDLLNASKEYDITFELYHDSWTCPLKHISMNDIERQHRLARGMQHHHLFGSGGSYGEPIHISNEPSVKHGSCWRININTPFRISLELQEITTVRFTDAQVRSLLESKEIIYWFNERQEWVTHTFEVVIKQDCIKEVRESWHLRTMIEEMTGQRYDPYLPGVYLQNPDRWNPYITIEPEFVIVGLGERGTGQVLEKRINE
ncbi:MAG: hypothetical protein MUP60_04195, partial [Candidatus Thorarchaeota archaeon]|nr:hypothetical protein [Candidatus Thorarchaeota archaeon]